MFCLLRLILIITSKGIRLRSLHESVGPLEEWWNRLLFGGIHQTQPSDDFSTDFSIEFVLHFKDSFHIISRMIFEFFGMLKKDHLMFSVMDLVFGLYSKIK